MPKTMSGLTIAAVSAALPEMRTTGEDFGQLFSSLDVLRIAQGAGIEKVYLADQPTALDLCLAAIRDLMERSDIAPASIDGLVLVTQNADRSMAAASSMLARRLGLRADVVVFDLSCVYSCYIYGLYQAALMVKGGGCKRVLVCTGDIINEPLATPRHGPKLVYGSAATCTLLEEGDDELAFDFDIGGEVAPLFDSSIAFDGIEADRAYRQSFRVQDSSLISFAFEKVPYMITRFLTSQQQTLEEVPYILLHQASTFMLHYLARKLGVAPEKIPKEVLHAGLAGPSSVPLMVTYHQQFQNMQQNQVIACGFDKGLSVSVCRLSLGQTQIHAPIHVRVP